MKKITCLFIFIIALLFPKTSFGFEPFIKSPSNPLSVSMLPQYTSNLQVNVFYENNLYKAIFVSRIIGYNHKLIYATSYDGLNWQQQKNIHNDDEDISNPRVQRINESTLKLYFSRYEPDATYKTYSLDCDNEFNCSSLSLVIEPSYSFENRGTFAAFPFSQNGNNFLFYGVWGNSGFNINLATMTENGWEKCHTPILNFADGPFVFEENGITYLFFHKPLNPHAISYVSTTNPISCASQWSTVTNVITPSESYEISHVIFPSILKKDNILFLYYSGQGTDGLWRLNLATSLLQTPSPTPTFTPTPTPTPTLTPLIIIPGLFSSWNKEALLYNQSVSQDKWTLNPIVHEYDGLKQTLESLGYVENSNYFLFNYDWRKGLNDLALDLETYINQITNNSSPITNFQIIGHSLGGLIARVYFQKYLPNNINKIITVGSPHQGVSQLYKTVEAGELENKNTLIWLAQKLILQINKNGLKTDKQIINEQFPIAQNLLSTFNFLKNSENQTILIENMQIKNDVLLSYQPITSPFDSIATGIVSESLPVISGYKVGSRTIFDQLLDYYPDGRPTNTFYDQGDGTVLFSSGKLTNNQILNLNHGELIYKDEAIRKILDVLNLPYEDTDIKEGKGLNIANSLLFLIFSPAQMEVTFNDEVLFDNKEFIFIENAQNGIYTLNLNGLEKGEYKVLIGQMGENRDVWSEIKGEITYDPPTSQTDTYKITFNSQDPQIYPINQNNIKSIFNSLKQEIIRIKKTYPHSELNNALKYLLDSEKYFNKKIYKLSRLDLLKVQNKLYFSSKKASASLRLQIYQTFSHIENLYDQISTIEKYQPSKKILDLGIKILQKKVEKSEKNLLAQKNKKHNIDTKIQLYILLKEKMNLIEEMKNKNRLTLVEILLFSANYLNEEIK